MVLRLSLFAAFLLFIACSEPSFDNPMDPNNISHPGNIAYESFTDARDGQTYKSVVIGTQTWMADNLNYDLAGSYCGDKIRNGTNIDTLVSKGGYCDIYGRLYNWNTAMSVCPSGWHLPSKAEWDILLSFASWKELKSKNGWLDDGSNGGGGDDKYGFTALPSGGGSCSFFVGCSSNHFGNTLSFGHYGYWWTATEGIEGYAYYIFTGNSETYGSKRKSDSYSVRCVKDGLCGSQPFNSGTQFCNGNSVYSLCSGKEYDPATQRCGTGNVVETKCGSGWIDASTYFCANNTSYELCDSKEYSPATQRCTGNTVETKCGSGWYDATNSNFRCQSGVLESKCGSGWYNMSQTQFCSNGTIKEYGTITDTRNNKTYKTVEIGTQTWMAENINYAAEDSRCYNDLESNCDIYGRLYYWATAMALASTCNSSTCNSQIQPKHKGVCPSGWHIPSNAEWNALMSFIHADKGLGSFTSGNSENAGKYLKSGWNWNDSEGISGNGLDSYGFSALPGGRFYSGSFLNVGYLGYWWSANENDSYNAYYQRIYNSSEGAYLSGGGSKRSELFSVRCLQD